MQIFLLPLHICLCKNINVLSFESAKNLFFLFSLTDFSIENLQAFRTFFERDGNSIKCKYLDGGTCKRNRDKTREEGVKKIKFQKNILFE